MLVVHRSAQGRNLAAALADVLATPLADPFAPDIVAVPARGVERWLAQSLAHRLGADEGDGVCALVQFPKPGELLDGVLAAASPAHAAAAEAWHRDRLPWALLAVLDELSDTRETVVLRHHLAGGDRRYGTAHRLAGLLHRAAVDRPDTVHGWLAGGNDVPDDLCWQPGVWRALRARLGPHPVELLDAAVHAVARDGAAGLPPRLSVYGASRLGTVRLLALHALAKRHEVHLFLHHPSRVLWERLEGAEAGRRAEAPAPATFGLLASLSRDVRELQLTLGPVAVRHHDDEVPEAPSLLGRLQGALSGDTPGLLEGAAVDPSVQVHACHGKARQVEVLREVVLGLLHDDPTLEPRDVLVLCPDVEAFAPLVIAAFGEGPAEQLRVQVADRSPRRTNPLLAVLGAVLELARSRVTASQVLDLAGMAAVRLRFGFDDDDLEQLRGWVVGAGVHWGLDAVHREEWGLSGLSDGTWRSGIDRLLVGAALDEEDGLLAGVLAHEGVESASVPLAGALAELVDRLATALRNFVPQQLTTWTETLTTAVDALALAPEAWQRVQLDLELGELRDQAVVDPVLTLVDILGLLEDRLQGRPTTTGFRTGALTVCTLTPMRSVPHRVVCLLGLDDGSFPRHGLPDGDDLLARDPRVGERDVRSEDRQLFLDALLAAGDTLVVTYDGADPRTGAPRPPAVPLGELLDVLPRGLVTRHPLQPFDERCFSGDLRSFDRAAHDGAVARRGSPTAPEEFLPAALEPVEEPVVALESLSEFWQGPAKAFLRQRLDVALPAREEDPDDALPLELDGLAEWAVGDRVLRERLAGLAAEEAWAREHARGELPPDAAASGLLAGIAGRVESVVAAATPYLEAPAEAVDIDLPFRSVRLSGTVRGLRGSAIVSTTYGSVSSKRRMAAWVQLLAASAQLPDRELLAVVIGRKKAEAETCRLGPVASEQARAHLRELLLLRWWGLRWPLPVPPGLAESLARGKLDRRRWESGFKFDSDDRLPENVLCFPKLTVDEVVGWSRHPLTFREIVDRVWRPLTEASS